MVTQRLTVIWNEIWIIIHENDTVKLHPAQFNMNAALTHSSFGILG